MNEVASVPNMGPRASEPTQTAAKNGRDKSPADQIAAPQTHGSHGGNH